MKKRKKTKEEKEWGYHFLHTTLNRRFREIFNKLPKNAQNEMCKEDRIMSMVERTICQGFELFLNDYRILLLYIHSKIKKSMPEGEEKEKYLFLMKPINFAAELDCSEYEYITMNKLVKALTSNTPDTY